MSTTFPAVSPFAYTTTASSKILTTGGGGSGGNGTLSWNTTGYSISNNPLMSTVPSEDKIVVNPNAALEVNGKLVLNGENLNDRLERIETLLHIPTRDVEMEEKYPKLKKLWEEYNQELSKYKTWEGIKGDDK